MIQVCAQCGTRWNVRDQQRQWCPRCRGALGAPAPTSPPRVAGQPPARAATTQLPPGFRWIAVRPGAPPPQRRQRRPLGPTPRYAFIPRWSLPDRPPHLPPPELARPAGPADTRVRGLLRASRLTFGAAALAYALRYLLLLINRTTLLSTVVAIGADTLVVGVSVAATGVGVLAAVALTRWLVARRATAFAHFGQADPRSARMLWLGCLIPPANLLWAPVFALELARIEGRETLLRTPVRRWWLTWTAASLASAWVAVTRWTPDPQVVADNTVMAMLGYVLATATMITLSRVFEGFAGASAERSAHRWLAVRSTDPASPSAPALEMHGAEPAA